MMVRIKEIILKTRIFYYLYLILKGTNKSLRYPTKPILTNAVLKTKQEYKNALNQVKSLGLILHTDLAKNWDSLSALSIILKLTNKNASILDGGGQLYSVILPWLFLYGFRDLTCINLAFKKKINRGQIIYEYGDITNTKFRNNSFDAITCLSVIEHGVDLEEYFKEMSRILKPGGILITSTDYWSTPIDTKNQVAYGVPIHIFTTDQVLEAIDIAIKYGLTLINDIALECKDKAVEWKCLKFTFIYFTLRKEIE
jgi:SAM-dependent methyltransferase